MYGKLQQRLASLTIIHPLWERMSTLLPKLHWSKEVGSVISCYISVPDISNILFKDESIEIHKPLNNCTTNSAFTQGYSSTMKE